MPFYTKGSVYVVTSSAAQAPVVITQIKRISGIKYFPASSATSTTTSSAGVLANSSTGAQIWFDTRSGLPYTDLLSFTCQDGIVVSLTGGASLWIYTGATTHGA